jgi:hypothetical protein
MLDLKNCIHTILDWCWEGTRWRETIVDSEDNGVEISHDSTGPTGIVGALTENPSASVEVYNGSPGAERGTGRHPYFGLDLCLGAVGAAKISLG